VTLGVVVGRSGSYQHSLYSDRQSSPMAPRFLPQCSRPELDERDAHLLMSDVAPLGTLHPRIVRALWGIRSLSL
jgi:hypothetical protein